MDGKYLTYSEAIIKSKVFDTEAEAQKWYDEESKALKDKGFDVYDSIANAPWDEPNVSLLPDGKWEAYVEANMEIYEDIDITETA